MNEYLPLDERVKRLELECDVLKNEIAELKATKLDEIVRDPQSYACLVPEEKFQSLLARIDEIEKAVAAPFLEKFFSPEPQESLVNKVDALDVRLQRLESLARTTSLHVPTKPAQVKSEETLLREAQEREAERRKAAQPIFWTQTTGTNYK